MLAQDASAEFGRTTGGELSVLVKRPSQLSGSFGFSFGSSQGMGHSNALNGSIGGTLVPDRFWFFASVRRDERPLTTMYVPAPVVDGKANAQLGSASTLSASFLSNRTVLTDQRSDAKTFHFSSVVSPNSFFTVSASQRTVK